MILAHIDMLARQVGEFHVNEYGYQFFDNFLYTFVPVFEGSCSRAGMHVII